MPQTNTASSGAAICPTCGQPIRNATTHIGKLVRRYAQRRNMSQADIAKAAGASPQAVSFLWNGTQGTQAYPYLGLRPSRKGQRPLAYRVADALRIPDREVAEATLADQLEQVKTSGRTVRKAHKACYLEPAPYQAKRVIKLPSHGILQVPTGFVA